MFRTFIDLFIVGQPIITFTALLDPTLEVSESSQPERTPARQSWSHSGISFQPIVMSRLVSRKRLWLTIHMEEDSNLHGRHQNMKKLLLAFLMLSWTALATWPSSPIHQQPRYVPSLINRHKYAINTTLTFYIKSGWPVIWECNHFTTPHIYTVCTQAIPHSDREPNSKVEILLHGKSTAQVFRSQGNYTTVVPEDMNTLAIQIYNIIIMCSYSVLCWVPPCSMAILSYMSVTWLASSLNFHLCTKICMVSWYAGFIATGYRHVYVDKFLWSAYTFIYDCSGLTVCISAIVHVLGAYFVDM